MTPRIAAEEGEQTFSNSRVIITISVDWEGFPLKDENLKAIEAFGEKFPSVPLTHFLSAANFSRDQSADSVKEKIGRVIRDTDETGLHIHAWRTLVEASGVEFRKGPTFWGERFFALRTYRFGDQGHEVDLSAYDKEEIENVAKTSVEILEENGFTLSKSFRAAGWIAPRSVLEGIAAAGFRVDSSATDHRWIKDEVGDFEIYSRMQQVWPEITQHSQPYRIETESGTLLEMPNSGSMADYVTTDEMDLHLKDVLGKATRGETRFVHFGFHQETATQYLPRVTDCLSKWMGTKQITFMTLENAAEEAQRLLDQQQPQASSK